MVRTSSRNKKPIDRLVDKETAHWKPSEHTTVKEVTSDKRSAKNQEDAAHFEEETAKQEGHPDNPKVKKELEKVLKELKENRD